VPLPQPNPRFCPECGTNLQSYDIRPNEPPREVIPIQAAAPVPQLHEDTEMGRLSTYELGRRLESMAASIFESMGYSVEVRKKVPTRSGSVCEFDVYLQRGPRRMAVECKNYDVSRSVGVQDLHVFRDKLLDSGIYSGVFITNTSFSDEAEKLAEASSIDLWDGSELREKFTATALGRMGTGLDEHTILPLATNYAAATNVPLKNREAVHVFNPMLVYHPYIQVSYRMQARRKDGANKTHRFSDSGTYFVDALDGDIINRDRSVIAGIGDLFRGKEARLAGREAMMVAEDLKNISPMKKAVASAPEYKVVVEKPVISIREAAETVRGYAMKKNTQNVRYEKKIKDETVVRTFQFVPEANEVSMYGEKLIHVPEWDMNLEAGQSVFSRRILASSNRVITDGLAICSICTILRKASAVVCEECGRPLCEKHSYLEGRWLCQDHISNALKEQIKSKSFLSRLKAGLGQR